MTTQEYDHLEEQLTNEELRLKALRAADSYAPDGQDRYEAWAMRGLIERSERRERELRMALGMVV